VGRSDQSAGGPMFDLPRRADSEVALHLLDRRDTPLLQEGSIAPRSFSAPLREVLLEPGYRALHSELGSRFVVALSRGVVVEAVLSAFVDVTLMRNIRCF